MKIFPVAEAKTDENIIANPVEQTEKAPLNATSLLSISQSNTIEKPVFGDLKALENEAKSKEEQAKKMKAALDSNLIALNRFMFCLLLVAMFITNLILWVYIGS
jgi:hypothetical protein